MRQEETGRNLDGHSAVVAFRGTVGLLWLQDTMLRVPQSPGKVWQHSTLQCASWRPLDILIVNGCF